MGLIGLKRRMANFLVGKFSNSTFVSSTSSYDQSTSPRVVALIEPRTILGQFPRTVALFCLLARTAITMISVLVPKY